VNNNDTAKNVHRAKLLDRRAIPPMTDDIPVATDVLLHNLEPFALEALRRTIEQGLKPSGLDFTGHDSSVIVRVHPAPCQRSASYPVQFRRVIFVACT